MLEAFRHVVHATRYSYAGLRYLFGTQMAPRIELAAILAAFVWFLVLGRSLAEILGLLMLSAVLLAVETVNTAIEVIVNRLSPERTEFGRIAKDLGSAAVFFVLVAGGLYIAYVTALAAGLGGA